MILVIGKNTKLNPIEYEGLSTDDRDMLLGTLKYKNVSSTFLCVDTGVTYKLNTDAKGDKLCWYRQI